MKLIVFSGIDGAGKSTQINYLIEMLRSKGKRVKYLWVRGGYAGPLSSVKVFLKKILGPNIVPSGRTEARAKAFQNRTIQKAFIFLAILDLIVIYCIYVRVLNVFNIVVVADRYLIDSKIDFKLNYPNVKFTDWYIWRILTRLLPSPEKHLVLTISVNESIRRSKIKNEPFPDDESYLKKRLDHYLSYSQKKNLNVVDCTNDIESIRKLIWNKVNYTK